MILAHMAGIEIFGTGGLGGVHRGGEVTMDVSADLTELGRTPVTVISSGPKSFLDIERTLEYLETQGVMVGTFRDGRRGAIELPAFYTRESGIRSPIVVGDEREAASVICEQSRVAVWMNDAHYYRCPFSPRPTIRPFPRQPHTYGVLHPKRTDRRGY
jgi:pseudouridine-5'-phosphate glycosidase/pseudouridine kinase